MNHILDEIKGFFNPDYLTQGRIDKKVESYYKSLIYLHRLGDRTRTKNLIPGAQSYLQFHIDSILAFIDDLRNGRIRSFKALLKKEKELIYQSEKLWERIMKKAFAVMNSNILEN